MIFRLALALVLVGIPHLLTQHQEVALPPETTVRITLLWGEAHVIGHDGNTVQIRDRAQGTEADSGLIATSAAPVVATLTGDELVIGQDTAGRGRFPASAIEVRIPRHVPLRLSMLRGGELAVQGMRGDTEITNRNGSVSLSDMAGGLRVTATNGAIKGSITGVGSSASFASLNGEVDLTLPADVSLTARLRTSNGRLISEFPVEVKERETSLGPGVEVTADIGGGGASFIATTRSGDVTLRRARPDAATER